MVKMVSVGVHTQDGADVPLTHVCCRANEEIAQVRARSNAECVALNASLRKEQMKVESLERALEQKVNISTFSPRALNLNPSLLCISTVQIRCTECYNCWKKQQQNNRNLHRIRNVLMVIMRIVLVLMEVVMVPVGLYWVFFLPSICGLLYVMSSGYHYGTILVMVLMVR